MTSSEPDIPAAQWLQGDGATPLLTVRELLELDVIQRAGATFHGHDHQLERPIEWAHTGEIADIARFLSGGEAVLTSGMGFGATPAAQRRYIRSLVNAKVAVVVVETDGRVFDAVPAAALEEAASGDLPIIAVAAEFPFAAVTAHAHRRIINSRFDVLETVERIGRRFGELLALDADPPGLVDYLSEVAYCPVLLETAAGELRAYSGGTPMTDEMIKHRQRHWVTDHGGRRSSGPVGPPQRDAPPLPDIGWASRCLLYPVVLRGTAWGYLHVLTGPASPTVTPYLAERAATFLAVALLNQRVVRARQTQRQTALLARLREGDINSTQFLRTALTIGVDLRDKPMAAVALDNQDRHDTSRKDDTSPPAGEGEGAPPEIDLLALRLSRAGLAVLSSQEPAGDVLIVGLTRPDSLALVHREAAATMRSCGISGPIDDPDSLIEALAQARNAMTVAARRWPGTVVDADRLGLFGLLVDMLDRPALRAFVDRELGALTADTSNSTRGDRTLLDTLFVYADAGFNKVETAAALHIQRRTLYYRLDRISERVRVDLDDPQVRTRLSVAVAARRLLGEP